MTTAQTVGADVDATPFQMQEAALAAEILLEARDITVRYGALVAIDHAHFEVRRGEVLGIIGPNGAGKSSTFAALTNTVRRSGSVTLMGLCIDGIRTNRLATLGLKRTFQQNSFFGDLTVLENAVCALQQDTWTGLLSSVFRPVLERQLRQHALAKATELLRAFQISDEYHEMLPTEIPYGIQRFLSIAMAYGEGARVLLLDEPAAGIGGDEMKALVGILRRLRDAGTGVVVIEHHMDLIMSLADEIVVFDRGRQIAQGKPAMIRADPQVREAYLGGQP